MADKFTVGDTAYTMAGDFVEILDVSLSHNYYIVATLYDGDYNEGFVDKDNPCIVKALFKEPPERIKTPKIRELEQRHLELTRECQILLTDLNEKKKTLVKFEKDQEAGRTKHEALTLLYDYLEGKVNYFVLQEVSSYSVDFNLNVHVVHKNDLGSLINLKSEEHFLPLLTMQGPISNITFDKPQIFLYPPDESRNFKNYRVYLFEDEKKAREKAKNLIFERFAKFEQKYNRQSNFHKLKFYLNDAMNLGLEIPKHIIVHNLKADHTLAMEENNHYAKRLNEINCSVEQNNEIIRKAFQELSKLGVKV